MKKYLFSIGIAALALVTFGFAALSADFVALDDYKLIVSNPLLSQLDAASVVGMFTTYDPDLYVPLTLLTYHADRIIAGGFEPWMFHITNLILHAVNAVLVSIVLGKLTQKKVIGLMAGLLFAVHPLHTEAVMWASARKDLLSTFFFLLTLKFYLEKDQVKGVVAYTLGLLSKISIVPLPVLLILIDWYKGGSIRIKDKLPYFALSIVFGVIALNGMEGETTLGLGTLLVASRAILFYLQKLFLPLGLSVLVPYTGDIAWSNIELLGSFIVVLALTISLFWHRHKANAAVFGLAFFLLMLIPIFGNFVKGNEYPLDIYLASDRYAYIPSIGILYFVSGILYFVWCKRNYLSRSAIVLLIFLLSFLSFFQSLTWRSTPELYFNVVDHYENSHLAYNNIAVMLLEEGHLDKAVISLGKSLKAKPNSKAFYNLGQVAEKKGDLSSAIKLYERALEINRYALDVYPALVSALERNGDGIKAARLKAIQEKLL